MGSSFLGVHAEQKRYCALLSLVQNHDLFRGGGIGVVSGVHSLLIATDDVLM